MPIASISSGSVDCKSERNFVCYLDNIFLKQHSIDQTCSKSTLSATSSLAIDAAEVMSVNSGSEQDLVAT